MMFPFFKKQSYQDWVKFIGDRPPVSRKEELIKICQSLDISIYIDDPAENVHTPIRAVASEAELERRVLSKKAVKYSLDSRWIALAALIVSSMSLLLDIYDKWGI